MDITRTKFPLTVVHTAAELTRLLKKGKVANSGQCKACCPAHDDKTPSLSIYDGNNGNILLCCHAGCSYENIISALEQRRISINHNSKFERYHGLPDGILLKFREKEYVAHWIYKDGKGNIIGYITRYESGSGEKSYLPYFKREGSNWKVGYSANEKRTLYNLDKIIRTSDEPVWVVEGEKCCDVLSKFGLLATTSPGGANGSSKTDWKPLAARHIIIWPDNDAPGKLYALNVFQQLNLICESEFICEQIDIDKLVLKDKEDAFDFVSKGNGKMDILKLPRILVHDISDAGVIEINMAKQHEAMDRAEELLLQKAPYIIFQRKETIVRIIDSGGDVYIRPILRNDFVADFLNRQLSFVKLSKMGFVSIEPPVRMVDHYFSRAGYWKLYHLEGLILSPTLRSDGSLLEMPGYDKKTKLYYVNVGDGFTSLVPFPPDNNPDELRAIAIEQLRIIEDILCDFKFNRDADKSVMLAATLTALTRKNYLTAPAFGFNSPTAGSGKTLLANIVHIIATGSPVTPMAMGFNREESDKQLFAKLLEGRPIILIDNVDVPIKSGMFCEIQTSSSGKHTGRILGVSETKTVQTDVTFLITGNNLSFVGDLTRRTLMCTIDPKCEKPENRTGFKYPDLSNYIMAHRGQYVSAALSVMKAYILAGRPPQDIPNWGGFEDWSLWVRSPIVWCGYADPYETQVDIEANDSERNYITTIFRLWYNIYSSDPKKTSEIVNACNEALGEMKTDLPIYDLAQELLEVTSGKGKIINSNSVGQWLKNNHDRIMGNLKLVSEKQKTNVKKWRIIPLE